MATAFSVTALLALFSVQGVHSIQTQLVWNGAVSEDAITEVTLQATAGLDTSLTVELVGPEIVIASNVTLQADQTTAISLPVLPTDGNNVVLRYSFDAAPWEQVDAGRLQYGSGLVVLAGDSAATALADVSGAITVAANDLPGLPGAYSHVSVLALDGETLSRLNDAQLRAFLEYVGLCGRILLINPSLQVEQMLRQRAACAGRFFAPVISTDDVYPALDQLLSRTAGRLPDEQALGRLLGDRGKGFGLMALYLGGFLLFFVALSASQRSRSAPLYFSVFMTLLAGVLWTAGSRNEFVAWAEAATTDGVARYVSLQRASATGRGMQELTLRNLTPSPTRISGQSLYLNWNPAADERYFDWSTSLLQETQVMSKGSFPVKPKLHASADDFGVIVCNRSAAKADSAYLHWHGENYRVPSLGPGERWRMDEAAALDDSSTQLRLLNRRAASYELALLQTLEVPANGGKQLAWLMTKPDKAADTACHA